MKISARLESRLGVNLVTLVTDSRAHAIDVAPKATGYGSSANGGELLCLALATCYANDIYREAGKRGIEVERVEVEASAEFGGVGEPARHVSYAAKVWAQAPDEVILELMRHTDGVAEVQNTLRGGTGVSLVGAEAVSVSSR